MVMRKMTDTALIQLTDRDLEPCKEAIRQIIAPKWYMAHSRSRGALLIRRRAAAKQDEGPAQALESALAKVAPALVKKIIWAWSSGGEERYFPTGELFVLFNGGASQAERRKILGKIRGIKVETHPNIAISPPVKRATQWSLKHHRVAGFARSRARQALAALEDAQRGELDKRALERRTQIRVPVARVSVAESRRAEVFEIAARIAALPRVVAATPDFDVLGKGVTGVPQQWPIPPTSPASVHERNLVDLAWALVDPSDLAAPAGQFLASRQQVAVLDFRFLVHPDITYDLKGYDAADQDRDPRTPDSGGPAHGMWMSGVIGGRGHGGLDKIGMAPGAVIIPVRPSWSTEDDFVEVDGQTFFRDYEEFVERFTANWWNAITCLWGWSHSGLEVANMSIAVNRDVWLDSGIEAWMDWWLTTGDYGRGVFASASAGNNPAGTSIACPASAEQVFAVGWGNLQTATMLGNSGPGLAIVGNDGRWPEYGEDGQIAVAGGGGSSVASALVAGTVAVMKSIDPLRTTEEIKTILRLTTRKAPGYAATEDSEGYSSTFGWGFLNAYHAIDVAWRMRRPAAELLRVRYRPGQAARAVIQLREWPWSAYAGRRTGLFMALTSDGARAEQRWIHDRDLQLRHVDQAIDTAGCPFAELTLVGDFDGDGADEIALQLDPTVFWPLFADDPAHSFLVEKYDAAADTWQALGGRSPYASGLASPQVVFPTEHPLRGVTTADLMGDGRCCLVAWQDRVVNAVQYDAASDHFVRLRPLDFAPPVLSLAIRLAIGGGVVHGPRILRAVGVGPVGRKDAVLCVGTFFKRTSAGQSDHYLTLFVIAYTPDKHGWNVVPLSSDPSDTHILLDTVETATIESVMTGNFSGTANLANLQVVIHGSGNRLYYLSLHRGSSESDFAGYAVYRRDVSLAGRVSALRAGSFGFAGAATQLSWLSDLDHGNLVRFLKWNDFWRVWTDAGVLVSHDRKDNEAVDIAVAKRFTLPGVPGTRDVIALLMRLPDANTYRTYRWNSDLGQFEDIGVL